MKKVMKFVLAMAMVLMMSGGAMAEELGKVQGSTLVPNLMYFYNHSTNWCLPAITLTNITDGTIQCKIDVLGANGASLLKYATVWSGGVGNWGVVSSGTGNFEIPPHSTRYFRLNQSSDRVYTFGHAEIEWESSDSKARKALIGGVTLQRVDGSGAYSQSSMVINNGQPF